MIPKERAKGTGGKDKERRGKWNILHPGRTVSDLGMLYLFQEFGYCAFVGAGSLIVCY